LLITVLTPSDGINGKLFGILKIEGMLERILNIFLLIPLAILITYSFSRILKRQTWLLGAVVSITIEISQKFIPGRISDPIDVAMNSLGYLATLYFVTRLERTTWGSRDISLIMSLYFPTETSWLNHI
jgi:glycopeptide antibiotics resistance protein